MFRNNAMTTCFAIAMLQNQWSQTSCHGEPYAHFVCFWVCGCVVFTFNCLFGGKVNAFGNMMKKSTIKNHDYKLIQTSTGFIVLSNKAWILMGKIFIWAILCQLQEVAPQYLRFLCGLVDHDEIRRVVSRWRTHCGTKLDFCRSVTL